MKPHKADLCAKLDSDDASFAVFTLKDLQHTLAKLAKLVDTGEPIEPKALRSILSDGEKGVQGLSDLLSAQLDPVFYNELRTTNSTALVQMVFGTPELLEMVLLNVPVPSLLTAQRVSRQFFDAIENTQSIQKKMSLILSGSPHFSTMLSLECYHNSHKGSGVSCDMWSAVDLPSDATGYCHEDYFAGKSAVEMEFFVWFRCGDLPSLGPKCRKMFVCEPVVTDMTLYTHGCAPWEKMEDYGVDGQNTWLIKNENGITLGDLYDAISDARKYARRCPEPGLVQSKSRPKRGGTIIGPIQLVSDDPIVAHHVQAEAERVAYEQSEMASDEDWPDEPSQSEEQPGRPSAITEELSSQEELFDSEDELYEPIHVYEQAKDIAARNGQKALAFEEVEALCGSSWQVVPKQHFR